MLKVRPLLILTAVVSSILGAIVAYLILSVPNDLRADSLLKDARNDIEQQQHAAARDKLSSIVQQYPRTDAAAAAAVALMRLADSDRQKLERDLAILRTQNVQQSRRITDLEKGVAEIRNAPPKVVTVQAPAPKPPVKKAPPRKKTTTPRRKR